MDFIDQIQELSSRIPKQIEHIQTEEATKSALTMPFINSLGYNVFDPTEVVPEFIADVGIKKGEKVDYAILRDGKPIMLIECKSCTTNLDEVHASQLYRYFSVTEVRIGVLTNGLIYRFFSDLEELNKMDKKPFLEIDMLNLNDTLISELKKLTKSKFDEVDIVSTASELKYTKEIKRLLNEQLMSPTEDFIRFLGSQVYSGRITQNVRDQFGDVVKRAFQQFISDNINERLKSALSQNQTNGNVEKVEKTQENDVVNESRNNEVITTEEELEGYYIVKSILRESVVLSRIVHRDTLSYFGVLLDDNNRKPICRLYFNGKKKKYLALVNEDKTENKVEIDDLNDIYKYSERLKQTVQLYEG